MDYCERCGHWVNKSTAGNYYCCQCGYSNMNVTYYASNNTKPIPKLIKCPCCGAWREE